MTVAELIQQLQALPQNLEVFVGEEVVGCDWLVFRAELVKAEENFYATGEYVRLIG